MYFNHVMSSRRHFHFIPDCTGDKMVVLRFFNKTIVIQHSILFISIIRFQDNNIIFRSNQESDFQTTFMEFSIHTQLRIICGH